MALIECRHRPSGYLFISVGERRRASSGAPRGRSRASIASASSRGVMRQNCVGRKPQDAEPEADRLASRETARVHRARLLRRRRARRAPRPSPPKVARDQSRGDAHIAGRAAVDRHARDLVVASQPRPRRASPRAMMRDEVARPQPAACRSARPAPPGRRRRTRLRARRARRASAPAGAARRRSRPRSRRDEDWAWRPTPPRTSARRPIPAPSRRSPRRCARRRIPGW